MASDSMGASGAQTAQLIFTEDDMRKITAILPWLILIRHPRWHWSQSVFFLLALIGFGMSFVPYWRVHFEGVPPLNAVMVSTGRLSAEGGMGMPGSNQAPRYFVEHDGRKEYFHCGLAVRVIRCGYFDLLPGRGEHLVTTVWHDPYYGAVQLKFHGFDERKGGLLGYEAMVDLYVKESLNRGGGRFPAWTFLAIAVAYIYFWIRYSLVFLVRGEKNASSGI